MTLEEELEQLRNQVLTTATNAIPLRIKIILGVLVLALVLGGFAWLHTFHQQKAEVVSAETMSSVSALHNKLDISEANSASLKKFYDSAVAGKVSPVATYYVQSPTVETAATKVSQQINSKDASLPPAALATADRTTVVPNVAQQKVDVYKVNLEKSWRVKAGFTVGELNSVNVGLQHDKDELIYHKSITGNSVTYMRTIWEK